MEMRRFTWNLLEVLDDETIPFQKVTGRDVFKLNTPTPPYICGGRENEKGAKEREKEVQHSAAFVCSLGSQDTGRLKLKLPERRF